MQLFYNKCFPAEKVHAMKINISKFTQGKRESIPQAWGRFSRMTRKCPAHGMHDSELLDTFYNGLTEISRSYIDSVAGNIFRHMTIKEAKELLDLMGQNYDNWNNEEENNI